MKKMQLTPMMPRRKSRAIRVGDLWMGGGHPILVQSMITEETFHIDACVEQIIALHQAGCELVRVTTPTLREAECLEEIRARVIEKYRPVPLTADVHHQGTGIAVEAAKWVDEVRVNPGLFVFRKAQNKEEWTEAEHAAERPCAAKGQRQQGRDRGEALMRPAFGGAVAARRDEKNRRRIRRDRGRGLRRRWRDPPCG